VTRGKDGWIEVLTDRRTNRHKLRKKERKKDGQKITTTFTTIIQKGYLFVRSFIHQRQTDRQTDTMFAYIYKIHPLSLIYFMFTTDLFDNVPQTH
jgi:DNA-binding winged helix-turn-helix (wHTH) protein